MERKKEKIKKEDVLRDDNFRYALKKPHISEKSTDLSAKGFYVFKVEKDSNKCAVKKDVENKYKVNVLSVNIVNIPSKKRRTGRIEGTKRGYKKAIVKIKEGETIDFTQ